MKNLWKVLRYIRNYRLQAGLNVVFNILAVIFSVFSFASILPLLELIFNQDTAQKVTKVGDGSLSDQVKQEGYAYFQNLIDTEGKEGALMWLCIAVISLIFLKNFFRYLAMLAISRVRAGIVRDLRSRIYNKVLRLPLAHFSDERKGDIMARMTTDVQEIEWSILTGLEMIFREPVTILIFLGVLIFISPTLTLMAVLLLPVTGFVIGRIGKSLKRTSIKIQGKMGLLMSLIEETLGGLRIIKAFNAEDHTQGRFEDTNEAYRQLQVKMYNRRDLSSPLSEFLGVGVMTILIWVGGNLILDEQTSLDGSQFILYVVFFSQMITPVKAITTAYYNVQKGAASVERIEELLNAEETIVDRDGADVANDFKKSIEYRDVHFRYQTDWVLKGIDFEVKKGETVALVGPSGGGKSTLADLLPRFYDPQRGSVCIDGTALPDYRVASIRRLMGIVTQQSILFNDTVANNIAFGLTGVTQAEIEEAARVANAHEFIAQMENGYQTNIGDGGNKLSGGQRQRLSIARAVLKNPPILILDEATSALDTESEKLVQDALNKLMQNRTSIVIAHRLSTIQNADRILVIQEGEIAESGNHLELLQKDGVYKKLYDLQAFA